MRFKYFNLVKYTNKQTKLLLWVFDKGKLSVHASEGIWGSEGVAPPILNRGSSVLDGNVWSDSLPRRFTAGGGRLTPPEQYGGWTPHPIWTF